MVMVVNPSVPTQTVPEFIAYAKDNPGKVAMASAGTGSGPDVAGELCKVMTGIGDDHLAPLRLWARIVQCGWAHGYALLTALADDIHNEA